MCGCSSRASGSTPCGWSGPRQVAARKPRRSWCPSARPATWWPRGRAEDPALRTRRSAAARSRDHRRREYPAVQGYVPDAGVLIGLRSASGVRQRGRDQGRPPDLPGGGRRETRGTAGNETRPGDHTQGEGRLRGGSHDLQVRTSLRRCSLTFMKVVDGSSTRRTATKATGSAGTEQASRQDRERWKAVVGIVGRATAGCHRAGAAVQGTGGVRPERGTEGRREGTQGHRSGEGAVHPRVDRATRNSRPSAPRARS